jgi:hypothetical protein
LTLVKIHVHRIGVKISCFLKSIFELYIGIEENVWKKTK